MSPGYLGQQARFARVSGSLAISFTFDSHERHKSLFSAKSRKKLNTNIEIGLPTKIWTILVTF